MHDQGDIFASRKGIENLLLMFIAIAILLLLFSGCRHLDDVFVVFSLFCFLAEFVMFLFSSCWVLVVVLLLLLSRCCVLVILFLLFFSCCCIVADVLFVAFLVMFCF